MRTWAGRASRIARWASLADGIENLNARRQPEAPGRHARRP